ncbi:MAG: hypothetical protein ACREP9_02840 [Candidatus Dormibacteraceae bacterium]
MNAHGDRHGDMGRYQMDNWSELDSKSAQLNTSQQAIGGDVAPASFTVQLDQLPVLKAGMQQAQDELIAAQKKALYLGHIPSPGNDQVSLDTTQKLAAMAGDEPGQLGKALRDGIAAYQHIIDQCDQIMRNYQTTEDAATHRFKQA